MANILCFVALVALSLVTSLLREITEKENPTLYKADNGFLCLFCDKGQYQLKACDTDHGPSTCQTCPKDTFMDKLNQYKECAECRICHGGQETVAECSSISNTVCRCPRGQYLVGNLGYDGHCFKHSVCKDGTVVETPGTPWADTVCDDKPTDTISTIADIDQSMEDPDQILTTVPTKASTENPPPDIVRERVVYVIGMVLALFLVFAASAVSIRYF